MATKAMPIADDTSTVLMAVARILTPTATCAHAAIAAPQGVDLLFMNVLSNYNPENLVVFNDVGNQRDDTVVLVRQGLGLNVISNNAIHQDLDKLLIVRIRSAKPQDFYSGLRRRLKRLSGSD